MMRRGGYYDVNAMISCVDFREFPVLRVVSMAFLSLNLSSRVFLGSRGYIKLSKFTTSKIECGEGRTSIILRYYDANAITF